jgi:NADH:ubiquinone oxidoreductase subunit
MVAIPPARSRWLQSQRSERSPRSTSLALRSWEREHGRGDLVLYEREVMPKIQRMTVAQLMKVTGLSRFHCWKARKGERRLHARHWDAVLEAPQPAL